MQGNIWDIPAHYKNCQKKLYAAHVCMPEYQTYVANKFGPEATDINLRPVIGSKYSVLASKVKGNEALKNLVTNAAMGGYGGLTSKNTPFVVAGSRGELTVMSPLELQQNFDFASGAGATPINMETLKKRTSADNQLEWTAIKSKQASLAGRFMACFVPTNQQGQINTVRGIRS